MTQSAANFYDARARLTNVRTCNDSYGPLNNITYPNGLASQGFLDNQAVVLPLSAGAILGLNSPGLLYQTRS